MRLVLAVLALLLLGSTPAFAQERAYAPADQDGELTSNGVQVHYYTTGAEALTPARAQEVADLVARARDAYVALGFPAPLPDADGLLDVYVAKSAATGSGGGVALGIVRRDKSDTEGAPATLSLAPDSSTTRVIVDHEMFHVVQSAISKRLQGWLTESTAVWAAGQIGEITQGSLDQLFAEPNVPLDCGADDARPGCDGSRGYRAWPFFVPGGVPFVRAILDRAAALGGTTGNDHGLNVVQDVLAAQNTTAADTLDALGRLMAAGTLPQPKAQGLRPTPAATVTPASAPAPVAVEVNHLALAFVRIAGTSTDCAQVVPLSITAAPGTDGRVTFVQAGGATQAIDGPTTVAWATCRAQPAYLVLANGGAERRSFAAGVQRQTGPPPPPDGDGDDAGSGVQPDPRPAAPVVTVRRPACPKRLSRKRCAARRSTPRRWRVLRGTVAGATRVTVAVTLRRPGRKPRTVRRTARITGGRWTARVPALGRGRLSVRVTAVGAGGQTRARARQRLR